MKLKDVLAKKLTKKQLDLLPRSFDTIGSVALFSDFPPELEKKEKIIGEAIIAINKNIETVAKKTKTHAGKFRTKKVRIIAGKRRKETIHKESGIVLKLNVETSYFSPRSSHERLRIASLVKKNESILVMFSGVAPFPLVIAKNAQPKEIIGIEANPKAHDYALQNVAANKAKNITLVQGDVNELVPKVRKKFDRIVMPLPKDAHTFLPLALEKIKKTGIIHLYDFANENEIKEIVKKRTKGLPVRIVKIAKCGHYAPHVYRICLDLKPK